MNILMVGKYFYPVVGGVEIHMQNLARELIKKGHTVEVFTGDRDFAGSRLSPSGEVEGIRIRRFPNWMAMFQAIKNCSHDIVHYHLFRVVYVDIAIIAGKMSGKPLVFTPHCVYPAQSCCMKLAKSVYDTSFGRLSLALADRIIALTSNDRDDIVRVGANPDKIELVPNSIRFKDFEELAPDELFKNKYAIDKFLLYVGRVDWNKGLEHVIEAMPKLRSLGLKFVIIGEDVGYRAGLAKLGRELGVENDVVFTGKVPKEMLLSAYSACTFFILPSFYEGLPTVVLEAMAYGKPVIAARTGGTKYVIKHGGNGFLIDYGSPDDIYTVVSEALSSDLKIIGENARNEVKANYSWEISAGKIERIYEELLRRSAK